MAEPSTGDGREATRDAATEFEHVTVEYEDAPSACTIYPRDCPESEIATRWITAEEGAFVDLAETR